MTKHNERPISSNVPKTHGAQPTNQRIVSQSGTVHAVGASGYRVPRQGCVQTICDMHFDPNPVADGTEVTCKWCLDILARVERETSKATEEKR